MTVDAIDLTRHAVIEASAGTGKTYTIERLVLRILVETETTLDQVLLVTFTEKATGELRSRLRGALEQAVSKRGEHHDRFQRALGQFDQAAIFTIHGFCQRVLQEYALEQGQDFRATLVNDEELLPPTLRDVQRKLWRMQFGGRLRSVLEHAYYGRDSAREWDRKVREVAKSFQPRSEHQLRPAAVADWWQRLDEAGAQWWGQLEVFTVAAIRAQLADFKRQRGMQSFDDMIGTVEANLDPAVNADASQLTHRLRDRYHFGIVDEFQDTDPLQWRIFRRIFLEAGASRLFVVGDPKQAIFAFRGADLPTYVRARDQMRDEHGAAFVPLTTNWRSTPDLLEALNCLFLDGDWFPREKGIEYRPVESPPDEDKRLAKVVTDLTNRAALTMVDLRAGEPKPSDARKRYAGFVADEIKRLLYGKDGEPALTISLKNAERPLEPIDVAILVFKRTEATPLTEALEDRGIAYSFYRPTGFWQSREVRELELLLQCLARPDERSSFRKALLTGFFRVAPAELVRCQDLPLSHPARKLFQDWLAFVDERRWSALFQSMLEDTGLLLSALDNDAAAQRLAALRHVMGTLERVGHGENRDLIGLIDWLREKRRQNDSRDGEQPVTEGQRRRVRIMTIHASKGLEFPVVFLAGGFGTKSDPPAVAVYRDEQGRKVFDFRPDPEAQGRMAEEQKDETQRLLYVALTRPMFKLYVPFMHFSSRQRGYAGSAATILLPALKQACPEKLGPLIAEIVAPSRPAEFGDVDTPADTEPERPVTPITLPGLLFPPVDPHLDRRRIVVRSFSSTSRQHVAAVGQGHSYGDRGAQGVRDETAGVEAAEDPLRGPVFGDIVHGILEQIDYMEVAHCTQPAELLRDGTPARRLIEAEVRANVAGLRGKAREELEQVARQQVAQLVWNALHTPLAGAGGPLALLARGDRLHELAFLFPEHDGGTRREEAFVTGYMDLVFRHDARLFLVDFKTNLLAGYGPEQLAQSMDEADYHRQYRFYLHALARWLRRVKGPTCRVLDHLGGVYYLYVRGLNGRDESSGVFLHRPTMEDLDLARAMER